MVEICTGDNLILTEYSTFVFTIRYIVADDVKIRKLLFHISFFPVKIINTCATHLALTISYLTVSLSVKTFTILKIFRLNPKRLKRLKNLSDMILPWKLWCIFTKCKLNYGKWNDSFYKWSMIYSPICNCNTANQTIILTALSVPMMVIDGFHRYFSTIDWLEHLDMNFMICWFMYYSIRYK